MNFLLGLIIGSKMAKEVSSSKLTPSEKTKNREKNILQYIKKHPYSSCSEIAKILEYSVPETNATLTQLTKKNEIIQNNLKQYISAEMAL